MNEDIKFNVGCLKSHKFNFDYCLDELLNNFDYLQKQLEVYENMRKEAIEYVKEFTFEPLLINEDRKLIMYNENLKNFENILNKVGEDNE